MSRIGHHHDPQAKHLSYKKKKDKTNNPQSLLDYVEDPMREDSLVGLQYVVEMKILGSDKSIIKCNLCKVKGHIASFKEHLIGINHIRSYMEKHYLSMLKSFKDVYYEKFQYNKLLKNYSKEIERAEGTRSIQIEYVSAADMKKEQDNWTAEKEEEKFAYLQRKSAVLDRRQMALKYSETFKITSRAEASVVLNLTQHLSDHLEQYFLKSKGLAVLESGVADGVTAKCKTPPNILPPNVHESIRFDNTTNMGLKNNTKSAWDIGKPTNSICTSTNAHSVDSLHVKLADNTGGKRKFDMFSEDASPKRDIFPESSSSSGSRSRKQKKCEEPDTFPFTPSSSDRYTNDVLSPQVSSTEVSSFHSSSITAPYSTEFTYSNFSEHKSYAPDTAGYEQLQVVQNTERSSCVSQSTLNDNRSEIKPTPDIEFPVAHNVTDANVVKRTAAPDPAYSHTNSSNEQPPKRLPSSHTHGKTSKTLSPDILQLLKGKDANTVKNILKTLSPFYPALQDVNLDILAQVLVNTGALD